MLAFELQHPSNKPFPRRSVIWIVLSPDSEKLKEGKLRQGHGLTSSSISSLSNPLSGVSPIMYSQLRGWRKLRSLFFPKPLLRKRVIKGWCYYSRSSSLPTQPAAIRQASATGRAFPPPSCVIITAAKPKSFDKENQLQAAGLGDRTCPGERETTSASPLWFSSRKINEGKHAAFLRRRREQCRLLASTCNKRQGDDTARCRFFWRTECSLFAWRRGGEGC